MESVNGSASQGETHSRAVIAERPTGTGRTIHRFFTREHEDPWAGIVWEKRTCTITNDKGDVLFEQGDVEVPAFWSVMASNVVASKYFRGAIGTPERERSVRQLISRVVTTISAWGLDQGYFRSSADAEAFIAELSYILVHQYAAFNSPVWFNVGIQDQPQCSACFILSVDDSIDSLLELQATEARLFKYGSGTGSNLSSIRSSREKLAGGGVPSGPVSFMKGYDAWASVIRSGGKTRRAAKMQILNVTHPDICEFIDCKSTEEKKAWALIEAGYDGRFAAPGGAYESVSYQNANLSVRVTDEFMRAVEEDRTYTTRAVQDGLAVEELRARDVFMKIAQATHTCGDPGLQFDTPINRWHTCPASGRINASNPCSEYMHLDNSACNLASLNLLRFLPEHGEFDVPAFRHVIDVLLTAQDMLIDRSSYPTAKIEQCAHSFRQLGLGYANLGALLMTLGLPYDSDEGRRWAASITALLTGEAYRTSAALAEARGAFRGFKKNRQPMLDVIARHQAASDTLAAPARAQAIQTAARESWREALEQGRRFGFRNSQVSVLAPTGTISFMMDCDTTGIEPDIALVKYKKLVGGGFLKLVNGSVERGLRALGYSAEAVQNISHYINEHDTIEGAPGLTADHLPVFDCAFKPKKGQRSIGYQGHLRMMAAVQPFISGAISKTVNLPQATTAQEIFDVYVDAWRMGLKAVALYRDGSKRTQPLSTENGTGRVTLKPMRRRLPDTRQALTHKFQVGGLEGYLTVGLFEDGTPGELFIVVSKEGSTLSGVMDAFATSISLALQYGVPLPALVKKFSYMRFDPSGFTGDKELPIAHSIVDYVFRWLALRYLTPEQRRDIGVGSKADAGGPVATDGGSLAVKKSPANVVGSSGDRPMTEFQNSLDAPPCTSCGSLLMVRQAGCYVCLNCGAQGGCG